MCVYFFSLFFNAKPNLSNLRHKKDQLFEELMLMKFRLFLFVLANHHRHAGVVEDVITNTAQNGPPDDALPSTSADYHSDIVLLRCLDDGVASVAM